MCPATSASDDEDADSDRIDHGGYGDYSCALTSPTAGSGSSALFTLKVTNAKPEFLSEPSALTGATVGAFDTIKPTWKLRTSAHRSR